MGLSCQLMGVSLQDQWRARTRNRGFCDGVSQEDRRRAER